jgi:hypothetical protein
MKYFKRQAAKVIEQATHRKKKDVDDVRVFGEANLIMGHRCVLDNRSSDAQI